MHFTFVLVFFIKQKHVGNGIAFVQQVTTERDAVQGSRQYLVSIEDCSSTREGLEL